MSMLMSALAILTMITILNLVLMAGVIKRLRQHAEALSRNANQTPILQPGEPVGEFTAVSADGAPLSSEAITSESVIGFFSITCPYCEERLPEFLEHTRSMRDMYQHSIAVVVGSRDESKKFASQIGEDARVVLEEGTGGGLARACKVEAFPTLMVIGRGHKGELKVNASGTTLSELQAGVS